MAASTQPSDLYAVLQVHPSADQDIIEAAYRQLMKKYHPDVAGSDPQRIAYHHERAKGLNEAYAVLRDPVQRQHYDAWRAYGGAQAWDTGQRVRQTAGQASRPPSASGPSRSWSVPASAASERDAWREPEESLLAATLRAPFAALTAAYYLLPGPYEWESGRGHELLTVCLVPPLGLGAFALATGRLATWTGHSTTATLVAWAVLVALSLPLWSSLVRVLMAAVPSALLLSGVFQPALRSAGMPVWVAWMLVAVLSLFLSARVYVFGILPTLAACWLLTRFG